MSKDDPKTSSLTIITTQGVTFTSPVIEDGEIVTETVKVGNREKTIPVVDRHEHGANEVLTLDEKTARDLIKAGVARLVDPTLDEVDPTKSEDNDPAKQGEDALA